GNSESSGASERCLADSKRIQSKVGGGGDLGQQVG
ncbi:MAG: hypothetical protein DFNUSKGM_002366, partial [Candidatus Fervidibacter sacchari]